MEENILRREKCNDVKCLEIYLIDDINWLLELECSVYGIQMGIDYIYIHTSNIYVYL